MAKKQGHVPKAFDDFAKNIGQVIKQRGHTRIPGRFEITDRDGRIKQLTSLPEAMPKFMEDFMKDFVAQVFAPALESGKGVEGRTNGETGINDVQNHAPIIWEGSAGHDWLTKRRGRGAARNRERSANTFAAGMDIGDIAAKYKSEVGAVNRDLKAEWEAGFSNMKQNLTRVAVNDKEVGIGPGQAVLGQRLNSYNVVQGKSKDSKYGSFFYAAEFGTGVAENVGGANWMNLEGDHKIKDGREAGMWWFGNVPGTDVGAKFKGQKGLHFLFDARNRTPIPLYNDQMKEMLPTALHKFFNQRMDGRVTWKPGQKK